LATVIDADYEPHPGEELYFEARRAMEDGRWEEAVRLFEESVRIRPHHKSLELLGECLGRLDRWNEAVVALAAATTLNHTVHAPSLCAEALLHIKDYHRAIDVAEIALKIDPKNRKALAIREEARQRRLEELGPLAQSLRDLEPMDGDGQT
jgi:tetratricopeptide (TPR) repeat protein